MALLRSSRIFRRVLEIHEDLFLLRPLGNPSKLCQCEKHRRCDIIIIIITTTIIITIYGRFKRLINNISHQKTWTWLKKGNLKRETESLLKAAQDNALRTNHIKARIDKTQQNSKCRLCGDRDETINHIISEYSKLAQKEYKARHDWVGKVIHMEMCKKFQFDLTNKWYMHNPAPVVENDAHKLLWDFNIQTDQLILARRPDLKIFNKKKRVYAKLSTLLSRRTTE